MSALCWALQSWTQDSWGGLTRTEQRGRILSLDPVLNWRSFSKRWGKTYAGNPCFSCANCSHCLLKLVGFVRASHEPGPGEVPAEPRRGELLGMRPNSCVCSMPLGYSLRFRESQGEPAAWDTAREGACTHRASASLLWEQNARCFRSAVAPGDAQVYVLTAASSSPPRSLAPSCCLFLQPPSCLLWVSAPSTPLPRHVGSCSTIAASPRSCCVEQSGSHGDHLCLRDTCPLLGWHHGVVQVGWLWEWDVPAALFLIARAGLSPTSAGGPGQCLAGCVSSGLGPWDPRPPRTDFSLQKSHWCPGWFLLWRHDKMVPLYIWFE